jgi:dihydrofolate reductase
MRKIIAHEWMSLDGVVQAPSYADEYPAGGFAHGGWHTPYFDDLSQKWIVSSISAAGAFLFGRQTYEIFAAHWLHAADAERPLAEPLNTRPKYVASTTLTEPLGWANSILLHGDVPSELRALKHRDGPDLHLIGSAQLARTLLTHDLIDEMRLMIDPLVLGAGKRFFPGSGTPRQLRLSDSQVTTTGAILATYTRTP